MTQRQVVAPACTQWQGMHDSVGGCSDGSHEGHQSHDSDTQHGQRC